MFDPEEFKKGEEERGADAEKDDDEEDEEEDDEEDEEEIPDVEENELIAALEEHKEKEGYQEIMDLFEFQPKGIKIATGGGPQSGGFGMPKFIKKAAGAVASAGKAVVSGTVKVVKIAALPVTAPAQFIAKKVSETKQKITGENKWRKKNRRKSVRNP